MFEKMKKQWLDEEKIAHIHGWDFSHLTGRYEEELDLPWDYESIIYEYLTDDLKLLDIDTGGGEFLLKLNHPYANTSATEGYLPNVKLCSEVLLTLGIDFKEASNVSELPFEDESFDVVINRHGDFDEHELYRILKPRGIFITQQVGAENDRDLVNFLLPNTQVPFPKQYLKIDVNRLSKIGFEIIQSQEVFSDIKFFDVGALVWFAKIIEWEFPGFSVEACFDKLCKAQKIIDEEGLLKGTTHRYMLVSRKL